MGSQDALMAEASIGLAIAAPIGPMAIIVVRRTLMGGFLAGMTTGAGASTIHLLLPASLYPASIRSLCTCRVMVRLSTSSSPSSWLLLLLVSCAPV